MSGKNLLATLAGIGVVMLASIVSAQESTSPELPQNAAQWLNFPPVSVEQLKGKGVVLYFYEETCPRCRERWPEILQTAKKFEGQPVMFIAVNSGNPARSVASYTRDVGVAWPVIVDLDRSMEKRFSVPEISLQNIFQTVVITPTGGVQRVGGDFTRAAELAAQGASWKIDPSGIPAELKSAWLAIELGNYAQAGPLVRKSLSSAKPDVKAAAEQLNGVVQKEIETLAAEAKQLASREQAWPAYKICLQVAATYQGYLLPDDLSELQQTLAKDSAVLTEQRAAAALDAAKKTGSKGNAAAVRRAKAMLQKLVADAPNTEAAADAQAILAKLPAD